MLAILLQLTGCGGGNSDSASSTDGNVFSDLVIGEGFFVDSVVEGLAFRPGFSEDSAQLTGVTDSNGRFTYAFGAPLVFSVGDIVLGEVVIYDSLEAARITPVDMVNNATGVLEPAVQNIARFLQTIDYDGDPKNGIKIIEAVSDAARGVELDFDQPLTDFADDTRLVNLLAEIDKHTLSNSSELVPELAARTHLDESLNVKFTDDTFIGKFFVDYHTEMDFGVLVVSPDFQFSTLRTGHFSDGFFSSISGLVRMEPDEWFPWEINDRKVVNSFGAPFSSISLLAIFDNQYLVRFNGRRSFSLGSATLSKAIPIAEDEAVGIYSIEGQYRFCKATVTFNADNTGNLVCENEDSKPFIWEIDDFGGLSLSFSSAGVAEKDHILTLISGDLQSGEFLLELGYDLDAEENLVDILLFARK